MSDLAHIRGLNDRDLTLFLKQLYQLGFMDKADGKRMNSEETINELIEDFKRYWE